MSEIDELKSYIESIGKGLVLCKNPCATIEKNPAQGILPRCLYLEIEFPKGRRRVSDKGIVIVGINPGSAGAEERKACSDLKYGESLYQRWSDHFSEHILTELYYTRLREVANNFGRLGPILWTEIVKCQSKKGNNEKYKHFSLQDSRVCIDDYLMKELEGIPTDWPILAAGKEPYKALSYLFRKRKIIGVPHPKGFRGNFEKVINQKTSEAREILDSDVNKAVWLGEKE